MIDELGEAKLEGKKDIDSILFFVKYYFKLRVIKKTQSINEKRMATAKPYHQRVTTNALQA